MNRQELMYFSMWHMRCEILRHATRESCILSTKMLCEVYAKLGIRTMPVTVDVIAANQEAMEKRNEGVEWDVEDTEEKAFAMRCEVLPGGDDPGGDPNAWRAHILLIGDGQYVCDPSADQFARPEKGIVAKPSMFKFEDSDQLEEWLYDEGKRYSVNLPDGGMLAYEAHPEEMSWTDSPDWVKTVEGDSLWESVMAKTFGLIDLYQDEELPDLPELPPSFSHRDTGAAGFLLRGLASAQELGSPEDLALAEALMSGDQKAALRAAIASGRVA